MVGMGGESQELRRLLIVAGVVQQVRGQAEQAAPRQSAHADPKQDVRRQVAERRAAVPAMAAGDD